VNVCGHQTQNANTLAHKHHHDDPPPKVQPSNALGVDLYGDAFAAGIAPCAATAAAAAATATDLWD
jgi:hypothetical protein